MRWLCITWCTPPPAGWGRGCRTSPWTSARARRRSTRSAGSSACPGPPSTETWLECFRFSTFSTKIPNKMETKVCLLFVTTRKTGEIKRFGRNSFGFAKLWFHVLFVVVIIWFVHLSLDYPVVFRKNTFHVSRHNFTFNWQQPWEMGPHYRKIHNIAFLMNKFLMRVGTPFLSVLEYRIEKLRSSLLNPLSSS